MKFCMTHLCRGGCYRTPKDKENSKCRFEFPQEVHDEAIIEIKEVKGKSGKYTTFVYVRPRR